MPVAAIVLVARYSAYRIAWHRREKSGVAVSGIVPVADIVLVH